MCQVLLSVFPVHIFIGVYRGTQIRQLKTCIFRMKCFDFLACFCSLLTQKCIKTETESHLPRSFGSSFTESVLSLLSLGYLPQPPSPHWLLCLDIVT